MKLVAALIGCGKIGSSMADDPLMRGDVFTHAEAYHLSDQLDLTAVCDNDIDVAKRCADRWGVARHFSDITEMLCATKPAVVSVCTPDATHYSVMKSLIAEGSPVRAILCEKPLALGLADAEEIISTAETRGVKLGVAYMRRYAANVGALQCYLASGDMGAVLAVTGWYTKGVIHNGTHWFDLMRMLAGEAVWVEGIDALGEPGSDPTLDVVIGLANGALATLRAGRSENFSLFEMQILTSRGRVTITDSGHAISVERATASARYSGYVELASQPMDFGHRRDQMLNAVNDLAGALLEDRPPACSGADGLAALRIALAAIRSSAERSRRISLAQDAALRSEAG